MKCICMYVYFMPLYSRGTYTYKDIYGKITRQQSTTNVGKEIINSIIMTINLELLWLLVHSYKELRIYAKVVKYTEQDGLSSII